MELQTNGIQALCLMLGEFLVDFEIHEIWQVDSQENH